jgi:hypothetical protein
MKKFIAYFDYLGFRQFIENNPLSEQKKGMGHIFREIEQAISKEKTKPAPHGVISDLDEAKVNCLNFSDTIIFWTKDDNLDSLKEIVNVSYIFNWRTNLYFFPARGCISHGELDSVESSFKSKNHFKYNINSVFGKGLIASYEKAESQNWAGSVIDQTVVDRVIQLGLNPDLFLDEYAIRYPVPYKNKVSNFEFALKLVSGKLNDEAFKNYSRNIKNNFINYNKGPLDARSIEKLDNTIKFLEQFLE